MGLTNVNGVLFFTAWDYPNGRQLWQSDGTPEGTLLIASFLALPVFEPYELKAVGSTLFFGANDGVRGVELWAINLSLTERVYLPLVVRGP